MNKNVSNVANTQGGNKANEKTSIISRFFNKQTDKTQTIVIENSNDTFDDDLNDLQEYHNPILGIDKEFLIKETH